MNIPLLKFLNMTFDSDLDFSTIFAHFRESCFVVNCTTPKACHSLFRLFLLGFLDAKSLALLLPYWENKSWIVMCILSYAVARQRGDLLKTNTWRLRDVEIRQMSTTALRSERERELWMDFSCTLLTICTSMKSF